MCIRDSVKPGTEEGEVVSTIAIAVSAVVTTVIIALGVLCLSFLEPFLQSETMAPAFDNILPALFGGLAVVYVSKNWKIALAPLIFMVLLFILVPSLANSVGVLVPVSYTHLDVYKRQLWSRSSNCAARFRSA